MGKTITRHNCDQSVVREDRREGWARKKRRMVSTWELNTIMTTSVIEVREEEEVQRLGENESGHVGQVWSQGDALRYDSGHCAEYKWKERWGNQMQ